MKISVIYNSISGETIYNSKHLGAIVIKNDDDAQEERARRLGERVAKKALGLFGNG